MKDENNVVGDRYQLETGSAPDGNPSSCLTVGTGYSVTDPLANPDGRLVMVGGTAMGMSGDPAQSTVGAESDAGQPDNRTAKRMLKVKEIVEVLRDPKTILSHQTPAFEVVAGSESSHFAPLALLTRVRISFDSSEIAAFELRGCPSGNARER